MAIIVTLNKYIRFTALYIITFFVSLTYPSIVWDDWVLVDIPRWMVLDDFYRNGRPVFGLFHYLVLSSPAYVYLYKIITFSCYYLSSLLMWRTMDTLHWLSEETNSFFVFCFTFIPFNSTRHSLVMSQYAVTLLLFFTALYLFSNESRWKHFWVKILACLALLLSCSLEVHIVMLYPLLILIALRKPERFKNSVSLFFVPPLYWLLRTAFFTPQDIYQGFHSVGSTNIFKAIYMTFTAFYTSGLRVIWDSVKSLGNWAIYPQLVLALTLAASALTPSHKISISKKMKPTLFIISLILFYLAAFPFYVAAKPIFNTDWAARGQHLLGLGAALFIITFVSYMNTWLQKIARSSIMILFLSLTITYEWEFLRDFLKEQSIVSLVKNNVTIKDNSSFTAWDFSYQLNARFRKYRFYDWGGILFQAFKNESRFISNYGDTIPWKDLNHGYMKTFFRLKDYEQTPITHMMYLSLKRDTTFNFYDLASLYWHHGSNAPKIAAQRFELSFIPMTSYVEDLGPRLNYFIWNLSNSELKAFALMFGVSTRLD